MYGIRSLLIGSGGERGFYAETSAMTAFLFDFLDFLYKSLFIAMVIGVVAYCVCVFMPIETTDEEVDDDGSEEAIQERAGC